MNSSETKPTISIVIPSYNQGRFIGATIDSILAQNIPGTEILVMDGGSKDETVDVLKRYGARVQWVSEKDRGQSHAINKGFARSRSDLFGYINSDDTYQSNALAAVLEAFNQHPKTDIIYGDFNYIDSAGEILAHCKTISFDYDILRYDYNFICQPASFWRRSVFERIGPIVEDLYYLMDYEFYLRAAKAGIRFYHLQQSLSNLRLHKDCKTMSGKYEVRRKYQFERISILAPYRLSVRPLLVEQALHRGLKAVFRMKGIVRYLIENGRLEFGRTRKVMASVRSS